MTQLWRCLRPVAVTGALLFTAIAACNAQVVISPTVTAIGGALFHYNYTITNTSATDDLFDVSIHVIPAIGSVQNLVTPAGFKSAFDSGLGLVDFVEDSSFFTTGTPITGFGFDSKFAPGTGVFDANFLTAAGSINTVSGRTLTPVGPPVPEPGPWAFLASAVVTGGLWFARSRRGRSTTPQGHGG